MAGKHFVVNKDGTGQLVRESADIAGGQDILEMLDALVLMATNLRVEAGGIEGYAQELATAEGQSPKSIIPAEKFNASTRLAFVNAGNALDYAYRLVEDVARTERIKKLRDDLSHEMRRAGLEGDPGVENPNGEAR